MWGTHAMWACEAARCGHRCAVGRPSRKIGGSAKTSGTRVIPAAPYPLRRRPEGSTQPLCFVQPPAGALRSVPDLAGDAAVQVVYREVLAQSIFTLCPGNPEWLTEESHCVWETLEARSIPVVLDGVSWDVLG